MIILNIPYNSRLIKKIPVDITKTKKHYILKSGYDPDLVKEIKTFKGAIWKNQVWQIPINKRNTYCLMYLMGNKPEEHLKYDADIVKTNVKRKLFVHQRQIVDFILTRKQCLIAAEMGTGKTLATIEALEIIKPLKWWLVAPPGAQKEWLRQFDRWGAETHPTVISTYESLHKYFDWPHPDAIVFDESIKLKNANAQRTLVATAFVENMREVNPDCYIILLSGAPAPKMPTDWWSQIEVCAPGWIKEGTVLKFRNRLAVIVQREGEYGAYNEIKEWREDELIKLGKRLQPVVKIIKKKDCFDLPAKIFDKIKCTDESALATAKTIAEAQETGIKALEVLRQISDGFMYGQTGWVGSPKLDIIKELLDFYEEHGRLVIYAHYHASIDAIIKCCKSEGWEADSIDGRGWSNEDALNVFEKGSNKYCLVCHPGSVYGLNLSRTEALVYYSNSFNPDHRIQSLERRDRPGMSEKGTRIVDIINFPTDQYVIDRINQGLSLQGITIDEINTYCKEYNL